jgi:hypothetical protein
MNNATLGKRKRKIIIDYGYANTVFQEVMASSRILISFLQEIYITLKNRYFDRILTPILEIYCYHFYYLAINFFYFYYLEY